uniref:PH domain-containing protein n=1 Tax=Cryptomonas curvata TaxID=233186 RepID=A0A7S0LUK2_9CRYP
MEGSFSRAHACTINESKGHTLRRWSGRNVVMEGLMEKRGIWIRSWKTRYFVLESSGRLRYFRCEADKHYPERAKGTIPISMDTVLEPAESKTGRKCIKISASDGPTLKLSARSEVAHMHWVRELQKVQNNVCFISDIFL